MKYCTVAAAIRRADQTQRKDDDETHAMTTHREQRNHTVYGTADNNFVPLSGLGQN